MPGKDLKSNDKKELAFPVLLGVPGAAVEKASSASSAAPVVAGLSSSAAIAAALSLPALPTPQGLAASPQQSFSQLKQHEPSKVESKDTFSRTLELKKAIDASFNAMDVNKAPKAYFVGVDSYQYLFSSHLREPRVVTDVVIKNFLERSATVAILDVGAGDFMLCDASSKLYGDKVKAYGITAHRYSEHAPSDRYVFARNAEYLSEVFREQKFDFAFSWRTFRLLVDPVGTAIETYKTLKPGGILLIDYFRIRGCEKYSQVIVEYMQAQGYKVAASGTVFILQKTAEKPILSFPVLFDRLEDKSGAHNHKGAWYKPAEALLDPMVLKQSVTNLYARGQQLLKKHINVAILNSCDNLPMLFRNSQYQKLDVIARYYHLLAVVAKSAPTYSDYVDIVNAFNSITAFKSIKENFCSLDFEDCHSADGIFSFQEELSTSGRLPPETQIIILNFLAASAILNLAIEENLLQSLTAIGLPVTQFDESLADSTFYTQVCNPSEAVVPFVFPEIRAMHCSTPVIYEDAKKDKTQEKGATSAVPVAVTVKKPGDHSVPKPSGP